MPQLDLAPLRKFGDDAERLQLPAIAQGGFIVPGNEFAPSCAPGKEEDTSEHRKAARPEARSTAGSRSGPQTETAASSKAAYSIGGVGRAERVQNCLVELSEYHPQVSVSYSSSRFLGLSLPVGLFANLPFRARLEMEIPLFDRRQLTRPFRPWTFPLMRMGPVVPDVRAWAFWTGGDHAGSRLIRSHHQYPDLGICACMPEEWVLGVHSLRDYVAFCILWIAKSLHEREFGFYPGLQHYGPLARVRRNRPQEYCGCGKPQRYGVCCRDPDIAMSQYARWFDAWLARTVYLTDLAWQGRDARPTTVAAMTGGA
jgi:hypothetical protein